MASTTTYRVMDTDVRVPVRLPGGFGVVLLLAVDYVDNPLGDYDGRHATCEWARDGRDILRITQSTRGRLAAPPLPATTYTCIEGRTMRTRLTARARGVGVTVAGVAVELGEHPVADELAALGLDRRPVAAAWLSDVRMRFSTAAPLHRTDGSAR